MSKSVNYTQKELDSILKNNPKLKVSAGETKPDSKISIDTKKSVKVLKIKFEDKVKTKTSGALKTSELIKINNTASYEFTYSKDHVSFLFKGARLLTINQIFAMLQIGKKKFEVFNYKKSWHKIITNILNEKNLFHKDIPFFNDSVEVTLFRQAPRLVDEDALNTMFKYIIDALKRNSTDNPYGIIAEDNPKIVHRIVSQSEKGEYYIGIKIKRIEIQEDKKYLPENILLN